MDTSDAHVDAICEERSRSRPFFYGGDSNQNNQRQLPLSSVCSALLLSPIGVYAA